MKTNFFVDYFDMYGHQMNLKIFGKNKQYTFLGAIVSLVSLFLIGAVTIYFIVGLFQKTPKQIITNQDVVTMPYNNLSGIPLIVSVKSAQGFLPNDGTVFNIHAVKKIDYWTNNTFLNTTYLPLPTYNCTQATMGKFNIEDTPNTKQLVCLMPGEQNSIKAFAPDTVNGYSGVMFILTKCNPNNNPNCKSNSTINSLLEGGSYMFTTYTGVIDNNNVTTPNKYLYSTQTMQISLSLYRRNVVYLTQNIYQDDNGFVFGSFREYNFFTQGSVTVDYSLDYPSIYLSLINNEIPISTILLLNTPYVQRTYRSYTKAQAVLANIGGIIKFIMVSAGLVTEFLTLKLKTIEIGDFIFTSKKSGGKVKKLSTLNKKKRSKRLRNQKTRCNI